ncbi:MAG: carbamoyltransferase C-terminal domain-containing protein [Bacteroidota bacterium]|nr:carbamoyltransferase C-terminal domain-containing protein [Bacteroidota bacterium]
MLILGLNAYHGDSSACIIRDGILLAAVEEERFTRIKHWAGYPRRAIEYCLREAGATIRDVEAIAVNRDPRAHLPRKAMYAFRQRPAFEVIRDRLRNAVKIGNIDRDLARHFGVEEKRIGPLVHHVEHHLAHMASAFFVSPFREAAVVSTDGFGDFVGAMWGRGSGNTLDVSDRVYFPHSLGLFYLAMTQYLGFPHYGDEYKVMGLASYGKPVYLESMRRIVLLQNRGHFRLAIEYFHHATNGIVMTWGSGSPAVGTAYTTELENLLGPARKMGEPIEQRHKDIAASMQAMYEEAFFHVLNHVFEETTLPRLCLAGGTAMNSVANGKIFDRTPFRDVYIQAAAGDAGGALGAAYYVWNHLRGNQRTFVMDSPYWGPEFSHGEIAAAVEERADALRAQGVRVERIEDVPLLCDRTAEHIADGAVVGWFQGRAEWGPRALGNRSIVVDPRRAEMKDILNARIKRRESFRPFAPSILEEYTGEYFEKDYPDPFMIKVYPVREEKRALIPAVTHVDGSGRLQTVSRRTNPRYWSLIEAFRKRTGIPILLNTSFNENEPIVCTPAEALDTFLRTRMDVLVLGDTMLVRER